MTHAVKQDAKRLRSLYRKAFTRWFMAKDREWSYRWYAVVERYAGALSAAR